MYLRVLACDLDGTLAEDGSIATETWELLHEVKKRGFTLILVTGRTLNSFGASGPFAELFEAIVSEDGATIYYPRNDSVILPFGRISTDIIARLEELNIPFERGMAIAATRVPHDETVLDILRESGGGATVEYNKGAVMILPPGATKGTGLQAVLHELGYSKHNVIACGDAENDRSLFELVEMAVAVANATSEIKKLSDLILPHQDGEGVQVLLKHLLDGKLPEHRRRPERRLVLGEEEEGVPVHMDPIELLNGNLGIVGASASGKSWLAGLLSEELLSNGYQICIIDPEGDYRGLHAFPHTLLLGGTDSSLPPAGDVVTIMEYTNISLVIDLSTYETEKRESYVGELLHGLGNLRARRGRPHWFLMDEVHNFCPAEGGSLTELILKSMASGGFGIVSYQLSRVAPELLKKLDQWIITRLTDKDDLLSLRKNLSTPICESMDWTQLSRQPVGKAYFCKNHMLQSDEVRNRLIEFEVARRVVPHVRHLHKYLRAPLPMSKRFYFHLDVDSKAPRTVASLWEFKEALNELSISTLRYHLKREDFERWLRDVLHDKELARRIRKLSHRPLDDKALREAMIATVADRYEELESLI